MKATYIKPETVAYSVATQAAVLTTSLQTNSNIVDDDQALGNRSGMPGYSIWTDEEEE